MFCQFISFSTTQCCFISPTRLCSASITCGPDIAAGEHRHYVVAQLKAALVQPYSHVIYPRHGARLFDRRVHLFRIIGKIHPGNGGCALRVLSHHCLGRLAHGPVVEKEHPALGGLRRGLGLLQPCVQRRRFPPLCLLRSCAVGGPARGQHVHPVAQSLRHGGQVFLRGLFASRQVDYQRPPADDRRGIFHACSVLL